MTSKQPNVVIRRARDADYDDIMAIGDVFVGRDYMPSMYQEFLNDPDIYALVAEVGGRAVSFKMLQVLDGGKTIIHRGARTHPDFRGLGLFHKLTSALTQHARTRYPRAKKELFATGDLADRVNFQAQGYKELIRKRILNLRFDVKNLQMTDQSAGDLEVKALTYGAIAQLFSYKHIFKKLFPRKRLFNFFQGYRPKQDNIRHILNSRRGVFVTNTHTTNAGSDHNNNIKISPNGNPVCVFEFDSIDVISFYGHHSANVGLVYNIDIYAVEGFDYKSLQSHLNIHLGRIQSLTSGSGVLMVNFPPTVDMSWVKAFLKNRGISEHLPGTENFMVLYERDIIK